MIEGLRALPWLQAARDEQPRLFDCESCMRANDETLRREMSCGWLPPADSPAAVWSGPEGTLELRTCPGYTTQLPDVIDIATLLWWAEKGSLRERLGRAPARALHQGVDVLRAELPAVEAYAMRRAQEKRH